MNKKNIFKTKNKIDSNRPSQLKVMIRKKLLKIAEMVSPPKCAQLPKYERYRFQILIAQIEDLKKDFIKI